jgi:peptidoglycan hydrolase-like protein with peptidoglycan-binding domain
MNVRKAWKALVLLCALLSLVLLSGCVAKPDNEGNDSSGGAGTTDSFPILRPPEASEEPTTVPTAEVYTPDPSPEVEGTAVQPWGGSSAQPGLYPTSTVSIATLVPTSVPTATVVPTPVPTARPATPAPTSSALKLGSKGAAVRSLQQRLKTLGYLKGSVDGDFGKDTETALKAFQRRSRLTVDGIAGSATMAKLSSPDAPKAQPTASPTPRPTATPKVNVNTFLQLGSSGAEVRKMQNRLIELGYLDGKATGYFNAATEAAVIAFQKRNVSYSDGIAGPLTLSTLYSSNAKKTSSFAGVIGISLKRGMMDSASVKSLQQRLKGLRYYSGSIDGDFGASTEQAVRDFQAQHNIKVDGVAGESTLNLLFSKNAQTAGANRQTPTPKPQVKITPIPQTTPITVFVNVTPDPSGNYVTLRPGDGGILVKNLQLALRAQGYLQDEVDGKYGLATIEAVKKFQAAKGLSQDGIAGPATQRILFEGNHPIGS